jgi:hypothetical protein
MSGENAGTGLSTVTFTVALEQPLANFGPAIKV